MTLGERALNLARQGFHVFPISPGAKFPPLIQDFPHQASTNEKQIATWWEQWPNANIGISTTRFNESEALLVVDVDNKKGKMGENELVRLEISGELDFPVTREQITPSGGRHLIYSVDKPVKQGVDKLGPGLDIRSNGGYIVGLDSIVGGQRYEGQDGGVVPAPQRLVTYCGRPSPKPENRTVAGAPDISPENSVSRARHYLEKEAPIAAEGSGGDHTTYTVAAKLKDFGVSKDTAWLLMEDLWNDRCQPPWTADQLLSKIENAYRYGVNPPGSLSPDTAFTPVATPVDETTLSPIEKLNREYAYVISGGVDHILWETKDHKNKFKLEHMSLPTFHQKLVANKFTPDGSEKSIPITKAWMNSDKRRSYDGFCFAPGTKVGDRFYNLWRGFTVEMPKPGEAFTEEAHNGFKDFLDHTLTNICGGNKKDFDWLMNYCAHLVQRPWEKPLTCLVFKGKKGVGKNFFVETIGDLLGVHFLLTADKRYLLGNFNSHLENCLMLALDEAFWSGDKQADGILKNLITGRTHVIERKGQESYTVDNCLRVVVIGNEEWLVPASADERRYAVFNVGTGRQKDIGYFSQIANGLRAGGHRLLLGYLHGLSCDTRLINQAPNTQGLLDQKLASLDSFGQWWKDCLDEGRIINGDFEQSWPENPAVTQFWAAYRRYCKERGMSAWKESNHSLGRKFKDFLPTMEKRSKTMVDGRKLNSYPLPNLEQSKIDWEWYLARS